MKRPLYRVIACLFLSLGLISCGGGGGGSSSGKAIPQSPDVVLKSFSQALTTNNESAATSLFSEVTAQKNLSMWRSLTNEQRYFFGKAIEEGANIPQISENQDRIQIGVSIRTENDTLVKVPIIMYRQADGSWKISDW